MQLAMPSGRPAGQSLHREVGRNLPLQQIGENWEALELLALGVPLKEA